MRDRPEAHLLPAVSVQLGPEALELIADRVVKMLEERGALGGPDLDPWLDVEAAAAYVAAKPKRIYDLCSQRRIEFVKDGSRTLIRRSALDAYLAAGPQ